MSIGKRLFTIGLALSLLVGANALAQSLTIQGKVMDSSNNPITGTAVQFRVQIKAPDTAKCVLYDETQTINLSTTNGLFSLSLNDGSGTPNTPTTYGLEAAISNRADFAVNSSYCASGSGMVTYHPGDTDNRKIVISFYDPGSMSGFEQIPEMDLNPMAFAMESRTVGGYPASSLLRVVTSGAPGTAPTLSATSAAELEALGAGTSSKYTPASATNGAQIPSFTADPSSPPAGSIWYNSTSGELHYRTSGGTQVVGAGGGGGGTITAITVGRGLSGGGSSGSVAVSLPSGTANDFLKYDGANWAGAVLGFSDLKNASAASAVGSAVCTAGQTMYYDTTAKEMKCQSIGLASADVSGVLSVAHGGTGLSAGTVGAIPYFSSTSAVSLLAAGSNGDVLTMNGSGVPVWQSLPASSFTGSGTTNRLAKFTGASAVGNSILSDDGTNVGVGTTAPISKLEVAGSVRIADGGESCSAGANVGTMKYSGGSLFFCNASGWQTLGVSGAGLTSLNGLTANTQTFAIGSAGTSPAWSSVGSVHTLNLPTASASNSGVLSSADWSTFNGKLSASANFAGDVTGSYNANVVTKLQGVAVGTSAPVSGQFLKYSTSWGPATMGFGDLKTTGGAATMASAVCNAGQTMYYDSSTGDLKCQSIGLGNASISGTLGVANGGTGATSTSQNYVFAGPTSGSGAPTFRQLSAADISGLSTYWTGATGGINYAGGNVGVGTASPQVTAHIVSAQGSGSAHPFRAGLLVDGDNGTVGGRIAIRTADSTGATLLTYRSNGTLAAPTAVQAGDTIGGISGIGYNGTNWNIASGNISILAAENQTASATGGAIVFNTTTAGTTSMSERVRIDSNGNVGIGTAGPTSALHVVGALTMQSKTPSSDGVLVFNNSATTNKAFVGIIGTAGDFISAGSVGDGFLRAQQNLFLAANGSGTPNLSVISATGFVGIGTSAPTTLLANTSVNTVDATWGQGISTSSIAWLANGAGWTQSLRQASTASNAMGQLVSIAGTAATNSIQQLESGGVTRMIVRGDGAVGIGTTAPASSLDLSGRSDAIALPKGDNTARPSSALAGMIRYNTATPGVEYYNGSSWVPLAAGGTNYLPTSGGTLSGALTISSGGANVTGGINNNSGGITNAGSITGVGTNLTGAGALTVASGGSNNLTLGTGNGTGLSILDPGAATANYVTVKGAASGASPVIGTAGGDANINLTFTPKGTGAALFNGNVGIGTTVPSSQLNIVGGGAGGGTFTMQNTAVSGYEGSNLFDNTGTLVASYSYGNTSAVSGWAGQAFAGSRNAADFALVSNNQTRVTLSSSGNVGIGTTVPVLPLDIVGNSMISNQDSWGGLTVANYSSVANGQLAPNPLNYYSGLYLRNARGTRASPTATQAGDWLGILRFSGFGSTTWPNGSGSAEIHAEAESSFTDTVSPTSLVFLTSAASGTASEKVRINSAGNLGIGTASPSQKLEVAGSIRAYNPASNTALFVAKSDGTNSAKIDSNGSSYFLGGNVGIGSASPGAPLEVATGSAAYTYGVSILPSTNASSRRASLKLDDWGVMQDINGNGTKDFSIYQGSASTHRLFISNNGNVGVGLTSPADRLHVNGNVQISQGYQLWFPYSTRSDNNDGRIGARTFDQGLNIVGIASEDGVNRQIRYWGNFTTASDIRLKDINFRYTDVLPKLRTLSSINFNWKKNNPMMEKGTNQVGVVAQEVEEAFPELVTTGRTGYKTVNYIGLTPMLLQGIRELDKGLTQMQTEAKRTSSAVEEIRAMYAKQMATASRLDELQRASEKAARSIAQLESENARLKSDAESAKAEVRALKARMDALEKRMSRLAR